MFKTFQAYLETQQGEFPLTPLSSCCLLPLTTLIATPEVITYGGVITTTVTTGLELFLGGLIILLALAIFLNKKIMTVIALETNQNLFNLIFGSTTKEKVVNQESQKVDTDSDNQNDEGFWSKYNSDFQSEFQEVRKSWLIGIDRETKQVKDLKLVDLGYQNLKVFLEQHWLELAEEDRQQFVESARQMLEITDLTKYTTAKKSFSDVVKFFLTLSKLVGVRKVIATIISYSLKYQTSPELKKEIDSIFDFINHQTEYAKTVLELAKEKSQLITLDNDSEKQIRWNEQLKPLVLMRDDRTPKEIEEQIRKNQKAIDYFEKQIEEINNMTEEEKKDGEEFEKLLLDLIEKNRM